MHNTQYVLHMFAKIVTLCFDLYIGHAGLKMYLKIVCVCVCVCVHFVMCRVNTTHLSVCVSHSTGVSTEVSTHKQC